MQALLLAGGEGTRLRPLTNTVPKPVLPLVNRPFVSYMLDWLALHGVDDVVMSCGFLADTVRSVLGEGNGAVARIRYVEEQEPLGTAGAVKHAEHLLDERFLVLNGDILADFDLGELQRRHEERGAVATIALVRVEDPSAYGLVTLDADGRVEEFAEKPGEDHAAGGLINAGAYVLERSVLADIPAGRKTSFEREVFPSLVGRGLHGFVADGYWLDIGTPERYLEASFDILAGRVRTALDAELGPTRESIAVDAEVAADAMLAAPVLVGSGARIGPRASARCAVIGDGCSLGPGAVVERAVLLAGADVGADAVVRDSIVGGGASIGPAGRIEDGAVVAPDGAVEAGAVVRRGVREPQ